MLEYSHSIHWEGLAHAPHKTRDVQIRSSLVHRDCLVMSRFPTAAIFHSSWFNARHEIGKLGDRFWKSCKVRYRSMAVQVWIWSGCTAIASERTYYNTCAAELGVDFIDLQVNALWACCEGCPDELWSCLLSWRGHIFLGRSSVHEVHIPSEGHTGCS